jgi:hypothetical protein
MQREEGGSKKAALFTFSIPTIHNPRKKLPMTNLHQMKGSARRRAPGLRSEA